MQKQRGPERVIRILPFFMLFLISLVLVSLVAFWMNESRPQFAPQGVIVYYPLDNIDASGSTIESIGNYPAKVIKGDSVEGVINNALHLNPGGSIDTSLDVDLDADFTLSTWVKMTREPTSPERYKLISKEFWGVINSTYSLYIANDVPRGIDKQVWFSFNTNADTTGGYAVHSNTPLSIGEWHLLTVTLNGDNLTLYIDGIPIDVVKGVNARPYDSNVSLLLGSTQNGTRIDQPTYIDNLGGDLDDIQISNLALTPAQVAALYTDGINHTLRLWLTLDGTSNNHVADSAPYHLTGILQGSPTLVPGIEEPRALSFNGQTDYIEVPDNDVLDMRGGSFTLSTWVKTTSANVGMLMEKNDAGTVANFKDYGLYLNASGNVHFFAKCNAGQDIGTTASVHDGAWHHIVAVRDGLQNKRFIYVDSRLVAQQDDLQCDDFSSQEPLYIGARLEPTPQILFAGSLDDIKIYSRALNSSEITDSYQHGLIVTGTSSSSSSSSSSGSSSSSSSSSSSGGIIQTNHSTNITQPTLPPRPTTPPVQPPAIDPTDPTVTTGTTEPTTSRSTWFYVAIVFLAAIILAALIGLVIVLLRKKSPSSTPQGMSAPSTSPFPPRPPFPPINPMVRPPFQQLRPQQPLQSLQPPIPSRPQQPTLPPRPTTSQQNLKP